MDKPRISKSSWVMTRTHVDGYGEELWTLNPKEGEWIAILHVQPSGKLYLSIMRERQTKSKSPVSQEIVVDALNSLSRKIYEEKGILCTIGVPASERNAKLFSTVTRAGFIRTSDVIKIRRRPNTLVFRFSPEEENLI